MDHGDYDPINDPVIPTTGEKIIAAVLFVGLAIVLGLITAGILAGIDWLVSGAIKR